MLSPEDQRHLRKAICLTTFSDDPSTKVGCLIRTADGKKLIYGVNALPVGIHRNLAALPREEKLKLIVHAEMEALCTAARFGDCLLGATLYCAAYDVKDGWYWGGAPCIGCTKHMIAAGITRVISLNSPPPLRWFDDCHAAKLLLFEAGVEYDEGDPNVV